ncbi:kelch repeat-containing protein At3g27220 isoform X2 [Triticum aestivum]|uniref:kelch repeat-containing protein At3g27220 isoform X2 n=1 Tax=Triticum aestivum TaxID=4565 RepID=UPI001D014238|nr:kelch repeat-containing protein At3g27220-like isoform X2 [Triticum aestivum]
MAAPAPPTTSSKPPLPPRLAVPLALALLLALAFVADFLSYSSAISPAVSSSSKTEGNIDDTKLRNGSPAVRHLNATFSDLPAPHWEWEEMPPAPVPRLDGASVQIGDLLYVVAGYGSLDHVHSHVDVYNFTSNTWTGRFDMPKMSNSHLGMASDGRYIYAVSGQFGPQCRPAVSRNFVLDTKLRKWDELPPLPVPRYAPATQLWRGRLHVMGGGKEDRHEPGLEHWSLAVKDAKALENEWRAEIPIPRGGPHRACVVANDKLFVIGGQEGDFMPKPGSPIFKCARRHEVVYGDVYMLDNEAKWKQLSPMPKPDSHIEFAWVVVNNSIVIVGGTTEKHPITKKMILVGEVFRFDLETLKWSVIGRMPFRIKTALAGYWDGWLYFTSGQRDRGPDNPSPKKVVGSMWRTKLHVWCPMFEPEVSVYS